MGIARLADAYFRAYESENVADRWAPSAGNLRFSLTFSVGTLVETLIERRAERNIYYRNKFRQF
jgi:hypothetical protein